MYLTKNEEVKLNGKIVFLKLNNEIMLEKSFVISYREASSIEELESDDAFLVAKAREASQDAWAPYSKFRVGAAVRLVNGQVLFANNQENAAYPSGLCAERVALFYANARYPDQPVEAIAVSASASNIWVSQPVKPCGACLQSMNECENRFGNPIRVLLDGAECILIIDGIRNLLPFRFDKNSL